MLNYENYLIEKGYSLLQELKMSEKSCVLLVKTAEEAKLILRVYDCAVPAYAELLEQSCENLPAVFGCESTADGQFFVEEEYIDGVSLDNYLRVGGKTEPARAAEIIGQVCRAVSFLHGKGFIHRDIKPEHILITKAGKIFLIDLNAASEISQEKNSDTQLLGTVGYAAPEQFGFSRSDARTDLYAIGILMNEILTGVHPSIKLYEKMPFRDIIEKCISMNPDDRYQTADELCEALKEATSLAEGDASDDNAQQERQENKRTPKGKSYILAGVLILVVAIGAAVFLMQDRDGADKPSDLDEPQTSTEEQIDGLAGLPTAEDMGYLPIYKDGSMIIYYNTITGSQTAALYTGNEEPIDNSFDVYLDEGLGQLVWVPELNAWDLNSGGCKPGATGFLHAEKDGKHYAIRILVFPEPMSLYDKVPQLDDLGNGHIASDNDGGRQLLGNIRLRYKKDEDVTLYIVAAHYFTLDDVTCDSSMVTIEEYDARETYPFPVKKLTFRNPAGGEAGFTVESGINTYHVTMVEEE